MGRRHLRKATTAWVALAMLTAAPAAGQEAHGDSNDDHFHANHVAVMAGGMTPLAETSETSFALGADIERRFNPTWGFGIGIDFTFGDHKRAAVVGTGVTYRPIPDLKLGTGPGFEVVETDTSSGGTKKKLYFIWGFIFGYDFHVGSLSIGPLVFLDFVGETKTNITYGISVGTGF
jgi:hypothetical protein